MRMLLILLVAVTIAAACGGESPSPEPPDGRPEPTARSEPEPADGRSEPPERTDTVSEGGGRAVDAAAGSAPAAPDDQALPAGERAAQSAQSDRSSADAAAAEERREAVVDPSPIITLPPGCSLYGVLRIAREVIAGQTTFVGMYPSDCAAEVLQATPAAAQPVILEFSLPGRAAPLRVELAPDHRVTLIWVGETTFPAAGTWNGLASLAGLVSPTDPVIVTDGSAAATDRPNPSPPPLVFTDTPPPPVATKVVQRDGLPIVAYHAEVQVIPASGGPAVTLHAGPSAIQRLSWSPDGGTLAVQDGRGLSLYEFQEDGWIPRGEYAQASNAEWAPDSAALAFEDADGLQVLVRDAAGWRPVAQYPGGRLPQWSPDGSLLTFEDPERRHLLRWSGTSADLIGSTARVSGRVEWSSAEGLLALIADWRYSPGYPAFVASRGLATDEETLAVTFIDARDRGSGQPPLSVARLEVPDAVLLGWDADGERRLAIGPEGLLAIDATTGEMQIRSAPIADLLAAPFTALRITRGALSPGATRVAVGVRDLANGRLCTDGPPRSSLLVIDVATGGALESPTGVCELTGVVWSPDGTQVGAALVDWPLSESGSPWPSSSVVLFDPVAGTAQTIHTSSRWAVDLEWRFSNGLLIRYDRCFPGCDSFSSPVFLISRDGVEQMLGDEGNDPNIPYAIGPDGQRYARFGGGLAVGTAGGGETILAELDGLSGPGRELSWSPDGAFIAYVQVWTFGSLAVDLEQATVTWCRPGPCGQAFVPPLDDPDGRFSISRGGEKGDPVWELWFHDREDGSILLAEKVVWAAMSPAGTGVAYVPAATTGDQRDLLYYDIASGVTRVLDAMGVTEYLLVYGNGAAHWSPDGSRIAYLGNPVTIRVARLDGSEPVTVLTGPGFLSSVAWSADGHSLLFGAYYEGV